MARWTLNTSSTSRSWYAHNVHINTNSNVDLHLCTCACVAPFTYPMLRERQCIARLESHHFSPCCIVALAISCHHSLLSHDVELKRWFWLLGLPTPGYSRFPGSARQHGNSRVTRERHGGFWAAVLQVPNHFAKRRLASLLFRVRCAVACLCSLCGTVWCIVGPVLWPVRLCSASLHAYLSIRRKGCALLYWCDVVWCGSGGAGGYGVS